MNFVLYAGRVGGVEASKSKHGASKTLAWPSEKHNESLWPVRCAEYSLPGEEELIVGSAIFDPCDGLAFSFMSKKFSTSQKAYHELLKDERWLQKRDAILDQSLHLCEECHKPGCKGNSLTVHHRIYIGGRMPWEYPDEFLEALCQKCHLDRELAILDIRAALLFSKTSEINRWARLIQNFHPDGSPRISIPKLYTEGLA